MFQYQLRALNDEDLDATIAVQVTTARFGVEGKKLTFGIESPLVRAAIQARAERSNVYLDISLSGEILSVQLTDLAVFLDTVLTRSQLERVTERLRKAGFVEKGALAKMMGGLGAKIGEAALKEGGKQAGKAMAEQAFGFLGAPFSGVDVDFPIDLKDVM